MHDYMKALHRHFTKPFDKENLQREVNRISQKLLKQLERAQRRQLLDLIDLEAALQDAACLHSFMSGFKLASSIDRELQTQPEYSFDADEEQRAREIFEHESNRRDDQ